MSVSKGQRVVITGIGVVSSIGTGVAAYKEALVRGISGASDVQAFDTGKFPSHVGCEVRDFNPGLWIKNTPFEIHGRSSQMAIAATRQALADSRITPEALQQRIGAMIFLQQTCFRHLILLYLEDFADHHFDAQVSCNR